jgi:hypothetical protein
MPFLFDVNGVMTERKERVMRLRLLGTLSVIVWLAVITFGAAVSHAAPSRQMGKIFLERPTEIAGYLTQGSILIVHDEAKMDRGEPCTTIYGYEPGKGPGKEIAKFACRPVQREPVEKFTVNCRRLSTNGPVRIDVLTEYQFPGETEGHGVPSKQ